MGPVTCAVVTSSGERQPIYPLWMRRHTTKFNGVSYPVQVGAAAAYSPAGKEQIAKLDKTIPDFEPGDTVIVNVKVKEGERSRVQAYEGVVIARSGGGINESFTVRKISYGEGVERVFPVYSPNIDSIKVVRRGKVRRAKLYYLRDRRGKSARIAERVEAKPAKNGKNGAK